MRISRSTIISGCLVALFLFAGCNGVAPQGDVGSGNHGPDLPLKHLPERPGHLTNGSVVSYATQYETAYAYNSTDLEASTNPGTLTNISVGVSSQLLSRTSHGYIVETSPSVGTTSQYNGNTLSGDPGRPSPSVFYYVTENATERVALPPVFHTGRSTVAVVNFDNKTRSIRTSAAVLRTNRTFTANQTTLATGQGAKILRVNASSQRPLRLTITLDKGRTRHATIRSEPTYLPSRGWFRIGTVIFITPSGDAISVPYYQD